MSGIRLDKWLWYARFCKSRSLAQNWILDGEVKLNGVPVAKASVVVTIGDRLEMPLGKRQRQQVLVLGVTDRRGNANAAALLYEGPVVAESE
jgi:ribosome-associated heat shock protein Hsp15